VILLSLRQFLTQNPHGEDEIKLYLREKKIPAKAGKSYKSVQTCLKPEKGDKFALGFTLKHYC